ncbi:MAG TPA: DUF3800 domain-containing protein [Solirubrobacterales bacterium]|nr:DUF3800 domain-containing protein [Solirubrobacterales bacterium]
MRFAYMDEAGNTGRKLDEAQQPIHLILSVVIDEEKIPHVHRHIRDMGRRHCPGACSRPDFEFHGSDLFASRGDFSEMTPERRIEIFDEVLRGIELAEADIVIRGVEKAGLERRYPSPKHPHDIALMFSIESIERLARKRGCKILLVADEAKEVEDTALRDLANYQELGTSWGWQPEQIDHIVDTIHFVPSHSNGAIQLADCATYIAARVRKIRAGLVRADRSAQAVEKLWEKRIEPHIWQDSVWYPG